MSCQRCDDTAPCPLRAWRLVDQAEARATLASLKEQAEISTWNRPALGDALDLAIDVLSILRTGADCAPRPDP